MTHSTADSPPPPDDLAPDAAPPPLGGGTALDGMVRTVLDGLPDAAHVCDRAWRWQYINPAAATWLRSIGRDPEQLLGRCVWDEFPEWTGGAAHDAAHRAMASGREVTFESASPGPAGPRHVENRVIPIPGGVVTLTRDVTEAHRALEALRTTASRLELAASLAAVGIWTVDLRTLMATHDPRLRAMLGAASDDERPAHELWRERIHPDDLPRLRALFDAAIAPGGATRFNAELRALWPGGEVRWLSAVGQLLTDDRGQPTHMLGVALDVTESRRAEEELRRWADIFRLTVTGVALVDAQRNTIIDANPALATLLGYEVAELRGMPIAELYEPEARARVGERVRQLEERGQALFETTYLGRHGARVPVRVQVSVVRDADGTPRHRIANVQAVSGAERRLAEQQRFLVEAGEILASSLDYMTTIRRVVELSVPILGDWAAFNVLDESRPGLLRTVAIHHADSARQALAAEIDERYPMRADAGAGVARVLRTGEPELLTELGDEVLQTVAQDAEHLAMLRAIGFRSIMYVPLVARGRIVGALGFGIAESSRRYGSDDLAFARELARRAALAIDNAELFASVQAARAAAEATADRMARLRGVAMALSQAVTTTDVGRLVVEHGRVALRAHAAYVARLSDDGAWLETVYGEGFSAAASAEYARVPLSAQVSAAKAVRTLAPVTVGDAASAPAGQREPSAAAFPTRIALPLVVEGRALGAVGFGFATPRAITAEDRTFLVAFAHQAAQALERARLFERERVSRQRTERLQAVTVALSAAATPAEIVAITLRAQREAIGADAGSVWLLDGTGGRLRLAQHAGYADDAVDHFADVATDDATPLGDVARTGEPVFLGSPEEVRARYPLLAARAADGGFGAAAALPLTSGGRTLGAMGFSFREARALGAEERAFAIALAHQCAQALERARLYESAQRARQEAEEANLAKSQFLATMSHELRTPLNAIAGYAELLTMGLRGPVTAQQTEDLARIQQAQRRLLMLVDNVLKFAKLEAGHLAARPTRVSVRELFAGVVPMVAPQLGARGLRFSVAGDGSELAMLADPEQAMQILLNLLSNAVKFTAPGGAVRLEAAASEEAVHISIADTGSGIPAERLEQIFEPFVQLDATLTRTTEGTGLGLAISRDLAHGMGGTVTARSVPGEGSTFTLTLPRAP